MQPTDRTAAPSCNRYVPSRSRNVSSKYHWTVRTIVIPRQSTQRMTSGRQRSEQASWALALAVFLSLTSSASAQAAVAAVPPAGAEIVSWSLWLQSVVNLMKVVELSAFTFSAYQFWAGRRERIVADTAAALRAVIDSNYQAWQVINSAQGKGGSGGRVEALGDLLRNGVSLAGINLDQAWLERVDLPNATLIRCSLRQAKLTGANLAGANLEGADLRDADLIGANLSNAYLRGANLTNARLSASTLHGADLMDVIGWRELGSISHADIEGVRNTPTGFIAHALDQGAVNVQNDGVQPGDEQGFSREFRVV